MPTSWKCPGCGDHLSADGHVMLHHLARCTTGEIQTAAVDRLAVLETEGCPFDNDIMWTAQCNGCQIMFETSTYEALKHTVGCDRVSSHARFEAWSWVTEYEAHKAATEAVTQQAVGIAGLWDVPSMAQPEWSKQDTDTWQDVNLELTRAGYGDKVKQACGLTVERWGPAVAIAAERFGAPVGQMFTAVSLRRRREMVAS